MMEEHVHAWERIAKTESGVAVDRCLGCAARRLPESGRHVAGGHVYDDSTGERLTKDEGDRDAF